MKTFKFLLPIMAMLLIGFSSCSKDDDGDEPIVKPPTEVVLKTFVVELEDTAETYSIGIDYTEQLTRMFKDGEFSFDYKTTITAKVPEKNVDRFLEIMNNSKFIVSVTEIV